MEFLNLTPHPVHIILDDRVIVIEPSGTVARLKMTQEEMGELSGIPIVKTYLDDVEGLPEPHEGVIYIVSSLVCQALAGKRNDIVAPDTSPNGAIRDEEGNIIGVRRLQIYAFKDGD